MADMSHEVDEERVDGRRLRRERNVTAVVDAALELLAEEPLAPGIEAVAERSGLSLRTVYRFFPDADALIQGAMDEMWRRAQPIAHIPEIGEGAFEDRAAGFATMRVRLYEAVGHGYRAGRIEAPRSVPIRDDLARSRRVLTEQFERHFAPELDALAPGVRVLRSASADVMSQLDAIDLLRRVRQLTLREAIAVVEESLRVTLGGR